MVANIRGFTPNYAFKLINFDTPRWHTLEYANWTTLDALLKTVGVAAVRGDWSNGTHYLIGERVIETLDGTIYRCLVDHTSAATGTFAADRAAHPTYWTLQVLGVPVFRGQWTPSTVYALGDIVKALTAPAVVPYAYYLCIASHTSAAGPAIDLSKWVLVFDATNVVLDAQTASTTAVAAAASADADAAAAAASQAAAALSEANAAASAVNALTAQGAFKWNYFSSTVAADPGPGNHRLNNATAASATKMYLSAQTADPGNPNISQWLNTWDDSTSTPIKGTIYIRKSGQPQNFFIFQILAGIVDHGTWLEYNVQYVGQFGNILNGDNCTIGFTRVGDAGATGTGGGDMLRANNLSDVTNVLTARDNIGVGVTQTVLHGQVRMSIAPTLADHAVTLTVLNTGLATKAPTTHTHSPADITGLDTQLSTKYDKAGGTITGNVVIDMASPAIQLNKSAAAGQANVIFASRVGSARWRMMFGNTEAESGANVGSNFMLERFSDAGAPLGVGATLLITRADGTLLNEGPITSKAGVTAGASAGGVTGTYYFGNGGTKTLSYASGLYQFTGGNLYGDANVGAFNDLYCGLTTAAGGIVRWGNDGTKYMLMDGTSFVLQGAPLKVNNTLNVGATGINGTIFFGNTGTRSLTWNGADYRFAGPLVTTDTFAALSSIVVQDTGAPTTGTIYFGNTGTRYLTWNGGGFAFNGFLTTTGLSTTTLNTTALATLGNGLTLTEPGIAFPITTAGPSSFLLQTADNLSDTLISFYNTGRYAINFGLDATNNRLSVGGWSLGAVKYKVWTEQDLATPVLSVRTSLQGNIDHALNSALAEPGGGVSMVTGASGWNNSTFLYTNRYRILQYQTAAGWVTATTV